MCVFTAAFLGVVAGLDALDEMLEKTRRVRTETRSGGCAAQSNIEKMLPRNAVSDLPLPFEPQGGMLEFRSSMYEAQRIAVNRAIFYSFALQNSSLADEPSMSYYFFSTLATLSANDARITGSRVIFAKDALVTDWFSGGNRGGGNVSLFGPYAWRTGPNRFRAVDLAALEYENEQKHQAPNPW